MTNLLYVRNVQLGNIMVQKQHNPSDIKKIKATTASSEKQYLAIDPGKSGGIAILSEDKVEAYKCPPTFKEMAELIKKININQFNVFGEIMPTYVCILERVHAFPTDGRSSAFKFGTNYGAWMGILESNNIEYELVMPKKWQHDFHLSKVKKERKQELKRIAKCFYEKTTLYTADAICMAVWRRAIDH